MVYEHGQKEIKIDSEQSRKDELTLVRKVWSQVNSVRR